MVPFNQTIDIYKYIVMKDEFGQERKELLVIWEEVPAVLNFRRTTFRYSNVGFVNVERYEAIIRKKIVDKYNLTEGIDEIKFNKKKFLIEKIEPVLVNFSKRIEYCVLQLKEKHQETEND